MGDLGYDSLLNDLEEFRSRAAWSTCVSIGKVVIISLNILTIHYGSVSACDLTGEDIAAADVSRNRKSSSSLDDGWRVELVGEFSMGMYISCKELRAVDTLKTFSPECVRNSTINVVEELDGVLKAGRAGKCLVMTRPSARGTAQPLHRA